MLKERCIASSQLYVSTQCEWINYATRTRLLGGEAIIHRLKRDSIRSIAGKISGVLASYPETMYPVSAEELEDSMQRGSAAVVVGIEGTSFEDTPYAFARVWPYTAQDIDSIVPIPLEMDITGGFEAGSLLGPTAMGYSGDTIPRGLGTLAMRAVSRVVYLQYPEIPIVGVVYKQQSEAERTSCRALEQAGGILLAGNNNGRTETGVSVPVNIYHMNNLQAMEAWILGKRF